jgi:hemerythrin-like domain-containing protein
MKRAEELRSLSRDHHEALVIAKRLREAADSDISEVVAKFRRFWRGHGQRHFRIEEELLLPAYERFGNARNDAVVRVLTDHVMIRRRADELDRETVTTTALNELGQLLEEHVRHEERVLFPLIERAVPRDDLAALAAAMEEAENARLARPAP